MRLFRIVGFGALILFLAGLAPANAWNDRPGERQGKGKPAVAQRGKPEKKAPGSKTAKPREPRPKAKYPREVRTEQQVRAWQERRGWRVNDAWREYATWREHRARRWALDHRTWLQRGGYGGFYIPEDRFSLYFGIGHYFRIRTAPVIVMGYPRFQYRGYSFMLVDPWPEDWPETWYSSDDVYIDYDDGYYLHNRKYPNIAIAVAVVL